MKLNKKILGGIVIAAPIVLSTTSCSKNEYTFNTYQEVSTYLQKHIVNAQENHDWAEEFGNATQDDYIFIENHVSFQLFMNSTLYILATKNEGGATFDTIHMKINKNNSATLEMQIDDVRLFC